MASSKPDADKRHLRIALRPRIYVLNRPWFDYVAAKEFLEEESEIAGEELTWTYGEPNDPLDIIEDGEAVVEFGGRVCYMSFGSAQGRKSTSSYLANILDMRHGSVLEHAVWSLLIADISRSLSHELVRHRQFSFSQQSSRYVTARREAVMPPVVHENGGTITETWRRATEEAFDAQEKLAASWQAIEDTKTDAQTREQAREARKRAKEVGRALMPHDAVTRLIMTGNARAWRWFMEVRGAVGAEPEIRRLACELLPIMQSEAYSLFADMAVEDLHDGRKGIRVANSKV